MPPTQTKIVSFGDSTTAQMKVVDKVYSKRLQVLLAERNIETKIKISGVIGDTTELAKARFNRDVLIHDPDIVIIQFGINDANIVFTNNTTLPRVSIDDFESNLNYFISTLLKNRSKIVLMTPNPMRWTETFRKSHGQSPYDLDSDDGLNVILKDYAEVVRKISKLHNIELLDVYNLLQNLDHDNPDILDDLLLDGVHPGDDLHKLVANKLTFIISKIITIS